MPHALLTAKFVSSATCPANKSKIEYVDQSLEGFFIEVLRSGTKTYYQRYIDGHQRQRQIKIGRVGIVCLEDARKRAIQILEFFDRIGFLRRVSDSHLLRPGTPLFPAGKKA